MRRSLINLYIQRASDGDEGYAEKLCAQLADRLLYVPTTPQEGDGDAGGVVKVHVLKLQEGHRAVVPVFTTEPAFERWVERVRHAGGELSLLGADLAQALGPQVWIRLDEGEDASIELQPQLVDLIAKSNPPPAEASAEEAGQDMAQEEPPPQPATPLARVAEASPPPPVAKSVGNLVQTYNEPRVSVQETSEAEQTIETQPVTTPSGSVEKPRKRKFLDFLRTGRDS